MCLAQLLSGILTNHATALGLHDVPYHYLQLAALTNAHNLRTCMRSAAAPFCSRAAWLRCCGLRRACCMSAAMMRATATGAGVTYAAYGSGWCLSAQRHISLAAVTAETAASSRYTWHFLVPCVTIDPCSCSTHPRHTHAHIQNIMHVDSVMPPDQSFMKGRKLC